MWEYLLHRLFGIGEPPGGARFGPGVVGHSAYVVIALLTASVGIAWGLAKEPLLALGVIAIIAIVVVIFLAGTWWFSHIHPDQAAMGGSYWFRFRQMQFETKDQADVTILTPTSDPLKPIAPPLPQIAPPEEEDEPEGPAP
jgi:hypothetical protein